MRYNKWGKVKRKGWKKSNSSSGNNIKFNKKRRKKQNVTRFTFRDETEFHFSICNKLMNVLDTVKLGQRTLDSCKLNLNMWRAIFFFLLFAASCFFGVCVYFRWHLSSKHIYRYIRVNNLFCRSWRCFFLFVVTLCLTLFRHWLNINFGARAQCWQKRAKENETKTPNQHRHLLIARIW